MTEDKTDWKVKAVLDRERLEEDVAALVSILKRQRVYCIVSASTEEDAHDQASSHLARVMEIPARYVKALHPRRLPT